MKDDRFVEILESLRQKRLPACPGNLEANVLRRIRLQKERDADIWCWLDTLLSQLSFAAPIVAVAILASTLTTVVATSLQASEKQASASYALGFDTFTHPRMLDWDNR